MGSPTTHAGIKITVEDLGTGDKESKTITDDVLVVTTGRHYVSSVQKYGNGTQTWTIKVAGGEL